MSKCFLFLIFCIFPLFSEMPEPYASIEVLPFDPQGWFFNAEPLEAIFKEKQPKIIIEIGSWLGCSTRFMASRLPKDGKLYAIDTWEGSKEHQGDPRLGYLFQQFLSNIIHEKLTDRIIPIKMTSMQAAKALSIKADLIYIDASHDAANVTTDILSWYPHLSETGIICGDDWNWPGVKSAVTSCAKRLHKKIGVDGIFWWYYD